jgi:hypothetical protein
MEYVPTGLVGVAVQEKPGVPVTPLVAKLSAFLKPA